MVRSCKGTALLLALICLPSCTLGMWQEALTRRVETCQVLIPNRDMLLHGDHSDVVAVSSWLQGEERKLPEALHRILGGNEGRVTIEGEEGWRVIRGFLEQDMVQSSAILLSHSDVNGDSLAWLGSLVLTGNLRISEVVQSSRPERPAFTRGLLASAADEDAQIRILETQARTRSWYELASSDHEPEFVQELRSWVNAAGEPLVNLDSLRRALEPLTPSGLPDFIALREIYLSYGAALLRSSPPALVSIRADALWLAACTHLTRVDSTLEWELEWPGRVIFGSTHEGGVGIPLPRNSVLCRLFKEGDRSSGLVFATLLTPFTLLGDIATDQVRISSEDEEGSEQPEEYSELMQVSERRQRHAERIGGLHADLWKSSPWAHHE